MLIKKSAHFFTQLNLNLKIKLIPYYKIHKILERYVSKKNVNGDVLNHDNYYF